MITNKIKRSDQVILGIGGSDHDFCAALIVNGELAVAIEDERLNRIKHGRGEWHSIPCSPSIEYCLQDAGIDISRVNKIYSNKALERRAFDEITINTPLISHHLAHASCVYLDSPFKEAAILVIDGAGSRVNNCNSSEELEAVSIGYGNRESIVLEAHQTGKRHLATCNWKYFLTNSLGHFYRAVTFAIGFGERGAGKTMGLASYGSEHYVNDFLRFVDIDDQGKFTFDAYGGFYEWITAEINSAKNAFMVRANLARAAQHIYEEALCQIANQVFDNYQTDVLCLSGGCALNTVANAKIVQRTAFKEICVHPASADSGTAIGAALHGWHCDLGNPRVSTTIQKYKSIAFRGRKYSDNCIKKALNSFPVFYKYLNDDLLQIAIELSQGKIIGWWQGRSENGQRALGHRSILASPISQAIRDKINLEIKLRESFRPLAPMIIEEKYQEYFEMPSTSPFMTTVATVKEKYRTKLSGVTHVDGTARVQTINKTTNPVIHELLHLFSNITGYPILINTSFNVQGQPIIEKPEEALESFSSMQLDALYLDGYYVEKHTPWSTRQI